MAEQKRGVNVGIIFKIIMKHFSGDTLCQNQDEIFNCVLEVFSACRDLGILREDAPTLEIGDVNHGRDTLRYLNYFGLVENSEHKCWRIKSVDEMCERLHCVHNSDRRSDSQSLTVSLAFEIIIQHISGNNDWRSTEDIKERVFDVRERENQEDGFGAGSVQSTLRFLTHFGLADKRGQSDWRIKSVPDMCDWLRELRRTFHLL